MKVITAASGKGGAGKSSLIIGIASYLHSKGKRTLILDLDEQASIAGWLNDDYDDIQRADPNLLTIESPDLPDDEQGKISGAAERLTEIENEGAYDFLIIDTKGEQARLTSALGILSDYVLCPTNGHPMEFEPVIKTFLALNTVADSMGVDRDMKEIFKVVITKRKTIESSEVRTAQQALKEHFTTVNGPMESTSYVSAVNFSTTIDCLAKAAQGVINDDSQSSKLRANAKREFTRHTKALEVIELMMNEIEEGA